MIRRSLTAAFAAVAFLVPAAQAAAESYYGGELVTAPQDQRRIDTPLTIRPSDTKLSQRLAAMQQRFGNMMPDVKLVVMDKDWLQQNNVLNGLPAYQYSLSDSQKETVRQLTSTYVEGRVGISFHPDTFKGLEREVSRAEGMAIKFQYGEDAELAKSSDRNICFLFPHFADQSRDQYYSALINRNSSIHGSLAQAPLRDPLDYEYMKRFVDYHEIGHCYDRWYIKNISREGPPQTFLENRHKAETFGEVFANLMLARDGYTQFSEKQADLRLAIAAFGGPISARVNDPATVDFYMTYAYLLHEGSRHAGREIERLGPQRLQAMSMDDILNLAHDITERAAFEVNDTPRAVGYMMYNRFDLSGLDAARQTNPAVQRRYDIALKLRNDMEGAVRRVFDFGSRTEPVLQPSSFNFQNPLFPSMGASALEARGRELAQDLRTRMGWRQSSDNLLRVYMQKKDELRGVLETGTPQTKEQASIDLSLMQMALKAAFDALPVTIQPVAAKTSSYKVGWYGLLKPAA